MKKFLFMMAFAAMGATSCDERPAPLTIDNTLTAEQIAEGRLTPEVMWKMSRAGQSSLSPDGTRLLYAVTDYSMSENRGSTTLCIEDLATRQVQTLTDRTSQNTAPQWSADGASIYFLSDRSGKMQLWQMAADGSNVRQLSNFDFDIEGFGVAASGERAWYVRTVHVADRRSADVHKDMDKSKARIYDDLMVRHWDYWEEGDHRHIFVADLTDGQLTEGRDIIGAEAAWDAPLAPYFDMAEISWNHAGTVLAYTGKPLTGTAYAISTDSDIYLYDVATQQTKNICKPSEEARDVMPGYDKYPVWSPDDSAIAFRSMRRAGNESDKERLFVYE
ncbi:MAG: PD40 domain-containing protein, partial [Alistipes sp.]|nr:PD40 domain-containing protein [Alistipes sp.]